MPAIPCSFFFSIFSSSFKQSFLKISIVFQKMLLIRFIFAIYLFSMYFTKILNNKIVVKIYQGKVKKQTINTA